MATKTRIYSTELEIAVRAIIQTFINTNSEISLCKSYQLITA